MAMAEAAPRAADRGGGGEAGAGRGVRAAGWEAGGCGDAVAAAASRGAPGRAFASSRTPGPDALYLPLGKKSLSLYRSRSDPPNWLLMTPLTSDRLGGPRRA